MSCVPVAPLALPRGPPKGPRWGSAAQLRQISTSSPPGHLSVLQELHLDSNPSLSGTIPSALGELAWLDRLSLYEGAPE